MALWGDPGVGTGRLYTSLCGFLQSLQADVSSLPLLPSMFFLNHSLIILLFDAIWLTAIGIIK